LLTKNPEDGGLGFGTKGSSIVFVSILAVLILYDIFRKKKTAAVNKNNTAV
jgi:uncharacterized membrane-anchored protein